MSRALQNIACMLAATTISCAADTQRENPVPSFDFWTETAEETDPFAQHRPTGGIWCTGVWVEDAHFEMITSQCNYASRSVLLEAALQPATRLRGTLTHEELAPTNAETATAHAAIALGSDILWDKTFNLPAEGASFDYEVSLERHYEVGEQLTIHLHNHGLNHYTWSPMSVDSP